MTDHVIIMKYIKYYIYIYIYIYTYICPYLCWPFKNFITLVSGWVVEPVGIQELKILVFVKIVL